LPSLGSEKAIRTTKGATVKLEAHVLKDRPFDWLKAAAAVHAEVAVDAR
jgi:hypothetical protein